MTVRYLENCVEHKLFFSSKMDDYVFKPIGRKKTGGTGMIRGDILQHSLLDALSKVFFRFTGPVVYENESNTLFTSLKKDTIGPLVEVIDFFTKKHKNGQVSETQYISCNVVESSFLDKEDSPIITLKPYAGQVVDVITRINFSLFTHKTTGDFYSCKPKLENGRIQIGQCVVPHFDE